MMLDLLIKINKDKLNKMISQNKDYTLLLMRSQKLDKYIWLKVFEIINQNGRNKSMGA